MTFTTGHQKGRFNDIFERRPEGIKFIKRTDYECVINHGAFLLF
jgi:hypothetical protein